MQRLARELAVVLDRAGLRATGRGRLPEFGGCDRCRRQPARCVPEDAHPRRSAVQREVLLHARRRTGFQVWKTRYATHRRPDLLGSVVSRSRAHHEPARRTGALLPDGHRLAPVGEGRMGRGAGRRVADHSARACDRQRRVRRDAQPHRPRRRAGHRRHHVFRPLVHRRPIRPHTSPRPASDEEISDRALRSRPHRNRPAQLALSARSAHRRLRPDPSRYLAG